MDLLKEMGEEMGKSESEILGRALQVKPQRRVTYLPSESDGNVYGLPKIVKFVLIRHLIGIS